MNSDIFFILIKSHEKAYGALLSKKQVVTLRCLFQLSVKFDSKLRTKVKLLWKMYLDSGLSYKQCTNTSIPQICYCATT